LKVRVRVPLRRGIGPEDAVGGEAVE
jgi:hypothetical protein